MANDVKAGRPGFRPLHPGAVLRHDLAAIPMSQEKFAEYIGVSRQTVNAILAGRSALTTEIAAKVSKAVGGTTQFWMNLQTAHDAWAIEAKPEVRAIKRIGLIKRHTTDFTWRVLSPASQERVSAKHFTEKAPTSKVAALAWKSGGAVSSTVARKAAASVLRDGSSGTFIRSKSGSRHTSKKRG